MSGLEQSMSAQIAEVLAPLLAAKIEQDAIAGFAQRISKLALEGEAPEIFGPAHLLEPLKDHADLLPPDAVLLRMRPANSHFPLAIVRLKHASRQFWKN